MQDCEPLAGQTAGQIKIKHSDQKLGGTKLSMNNDELHFKQQILNMYMVMSHCLPSSSLLGHQPSSQALHVNSSWTYSFSLQAVQIQQQLTSPFLIT